MQEMRNEIELLWEEPEDEVFDRIGRIVLTGVLGAKPPTQASRIAAAKLWIEDQREALCKIICSAPKIKDALRKKELSIDFAVIVSDVLIEHFILEEPVPIAAIAVLFVKLAYYRACGPE